MVWTEITHSKYRPDGLRYASDSTDEDWVVIVPFLQRTSRRGRPRKATLLP